jgi:hypothetical protein
MTDSGRTQKQCALVKSVRLDAVGEILAEMVVTHK